MPSPELCAELVPCPLCKGSGEPCPECQSYGVISRVTYKSSVASTQEADPNGLDAHAPGAKHDAGKVRAGLLKQFPRALMAVAEVCTHGALKYSDGGWQHVDNGQQRYTDAMMRHLLKDGYETLDPDSGLTHKAHLAWGALATLELYLREQETEKKSS